MTEQTVKSDGSHVTVKMDAGQSLLEREQFQQGGERLKRPTGLAASQGALERFLDGDA